MKVDLEALVKAEHLNLFEVFESVRPTTQTAAIAWYDHWTDRENPKEDQISEYPIVLQSVERYGIRAWRWFDAAEDQSGDWHLRKSAAVKEARMVAKRLTKGFYDD